MQVSEIRLKVRTAVKAAKFLLTVRAALPAPMRALVVVTLAVKAITAPLPVDGGIDEVLLVITGALLWVRHRPLLRACWRAAELEMRP